jgi:hypothetical protein
MKDNNKMKSFKFLGFAAAILVASTLPRLAYAEPFSAYCGVAESQLPLTQSTPVTIGVLDELGANQAEEAFEVVFESADKTVNISISESKKEQTATFTFPKEGMYKYKIFGQVLLSSQAQVGLMGKTLIIEGFGKIDIRKEAKYSFYSYLADPTDKRIRACIQELMPDNMEAD